MNDDVCEYILNTIKFALDKMLEPLKQQQDKRAVIKGIESTTGKYVCEINGHEYKLFDGIGIKLSINDVVWIRIPNGNMNDAYICAKANGNAVSK